MQLVDSSTENRTGVVNEVMGGATLGAVSATPGTSAPEPNAGRHESGYPVWRVACGDMINRDRSIAVYVDGGEVVVVGPPGESARLSRSQIDELKTALNEAAKLAER